MGGVGKVIFDINKSFGVCYFILVFGYVRRRNGVCVFLGLWSRCINTKGSFLGVFWGVCRVWSMVGFVFMFVSMVS